MNEQEQATPTASRLVTKVPDISSKNRIIKGVVGETEDSIDPFIILSTLLSVPTGGWWPLHHPPPVSLTWTSLLARPPPVKHHRLLQPRLQWGETPSHRSPLSGRGGGTHLLFSLNLWWGSARTLRHLPVALVQWEAFLVTLTPASG